MEEKLRKFYIHTFGCKVNQYESQAIRELLITNNYKETEIKKCDYLIINTCTVTSDADKSLRKFVRYAKKINQEVKIILIGCYVQLKKADNILGVYAMLNNYEKHDLVGFLEKRKTKYLDNIYSPLRISYFKSHTRAFVKIQDGCDNRCSFCSIWQARGKSRSRNLKEITQEVEKLIVNGYKEIVLTGICLGSYGKDLFPKIDIVDVIEKIEKIKGDFRIRLSSINPEDISTRLIDKFKNSSIFCPYLHLPLQSGSDKILKLMNRRYDSSKFYNLTTNLKKIHNFEFSTDVIVGFPQENEKDFRDTLELLKELSPIKIHIFPFSPHPNTSVFNLSDKIKSHIIKNRKKILMEEARKITREKIKKYIGKKLIMLSEKNGFGYSENYIKIKVTNQVPINNFLKVKILAFDESNNFALATLDNHLNPIFFS
jgi:threonylcarbamoyladenosine tRNA methylthiotransferase MtaB